MKRTTLLVTLLLLQATPAFAMFGDGVGGGLRRLPFFRVNEEKPVGVEGDTYDLPEPLPEPDNSPAIIDAWEQTDPFDAFIWALSVDINSVKSADIFQYGADVRRILVMRKLRATGYMGGGTTYTDLSGLTPKGKALLEHMKRPEIRALVSTIQYAEGTLGEKGYNTGFNYNMFYSFDDHPMTVWQGSSASGKYQIMNYTWPGAKAELGLRDFSPLSQDLAALYLVQHKRAINLEYVGLENFEQVVYALAKEWASFPCDAGGQSCYTFKGRPQPAKSMASLRNHFERGLNGDLPELGYSWHHWNEAAFNALKYFQTAYEVRPSGDFDHETYRAVFDGQFGTHGPAVAAEPEPQVVEVATTAPAPFVPVSPHKIDAASLGETIGGYRVSSLFGPRKSPCPGCSSFHPAWDIATPMGTPIHAPFDGIEVTTFYTEGSGHVLRFTYDGMEYSLLHMQQVKTGGYEKGWVMGYTGKSGRGTGPHLDVRVKQNGQWVLPSKEVIHFMLDPTAFKNVTPDPQPESDIVPPAPAAESDEVKDDESSNTSPIEEAPEEPRSWWQRLFGR